MVMGTSCARLRLLSNCLVVVWRFLSSNYGLVVFTDASGHVEQATLLSRVINTVICLVELAEAVAR